MNTFKIKPGEWEALTRGGLTIHAVLNGKDVSQWLALMKEELGDRWLSPALFRFGASSLLSDIERQLEHTLTGRYSAYNRHPLS